MTIFTSSCRPVDIKSAENIVRRHDIILIRHGQYVMHKSDSDCTLTQIGRQQAQATGQRLNQLGIQ